MVLGLGLLLQSMLFRLHRAVFLYEATSSRKNRSLGMELASATVASVFLVCLYSSFFLLTFLIVVANPSVVV
ncbi:unnamed protein product [Brassica oleracea]